MWSDRTDRKGPHKNGSLGRRPSPARQNRVVAMTLDLGRPSRVEPKPTISARVSPFPWRHGIDEFAREIAVAWQKSIAAVLETGRLLQQAKESLQHGDWLTLVNS